MARIFNAAADYLSATSAPSLNSTIGTVSVWVNPLHTPHDGANRIYLRIIDGTGAYAFDIFKKSDNQFYLGWYNNAEYRVIVSADAFYHLWQQYYWNLIVVTYDTGANQTKAYLNGTQIGSTAQASTFATSGKNIGVGYDWVFSQGVANAGIGWLAHWNRVLSASDISALNSFTSPDDASLNSGLQWFYPIDGSSPEADTWNGGPNLTVNGSPTTWVAPGAATADVLQAAQAFADVLHGGQQQNNVGAAGAEVIHGGQQPRWAEAFGADIVHGEQEPIWAENFWVEVIYAGVPAPVGGVDFWPTLSRYWGRWQRR